jgi:drug/metabolite transporter (DMT)-like permease
MGIASIPLMYVLTKKWFNATAALFTSGFVAVSQYTIFYGLIARPYIAGFFFVLLLLIVWTRMIFEHDFRWKNIIMFGVFAACCAYIHQFAMLTAFLIAIAGLFFLKKQTFLKYLAACLLAAILYAPHIPVLLHQIGLGGIGGEGGWLEAPKPRFSLYYLQYLFHFSWLAMGATALALIISSKLNKTQWNNNKIKLLTALLLFITPYIIGYLYSLYVNPVIQYSVVIFSFPFLLLAVASFIDSTLNIKKIVALVLVLSTMTISLVVSRQHYKFLAANWYEECATKTMELREKYGNHNVDCCLNMPTAFVDYYEEKYKTCLHNQLNFDLPCDDSSFAQKLESLKSNYLLVVGMTDLQLEIVKLFYPVLTTYIPAFKSEIYVFAKTGEAIAGMEELTTEEFVWDTPISADEEYIALKECNLSEICPSRFTKILLTLDYKCNDCTADYALVLQTSYKGAIADWRCVKPSYFSVKMEDSYRIFLPLRYELLVKDSKRLKYYDVKIFLWNPNKTDDIFPLKCTISTYKSNPLIYALCENVR